MVGRSPISPCAGIALFVTATTLVASPRVRADESLGELAISLLGRACEGDSRPVPSVRAVCGRRGRVAMVEVPIDVFHELPADAEQIHEETTSQEEWLRRRGVSLVVALAAGRLFVLDVRCGSCRRVIGSAYVVELAEVNAATLRALQVEVGLPRRPILRTEDAWRAAFRRSAHGNRSTGSLAPAASSSTRPSRSRGDGRAPSRL